MKSMKMSNRVSFLGGLLGTVALNMAGCGGQPAPRGSRLADQPRPPLRFADDIQPILRARCTPCHASSLTPILPQFVNNEQVFVSKAAQIKGVITTTNRLLQMPPVISPGGQLTADEKAKLLAFVAALNPVAANAE